MSSKLNSNLIRQHIKQYIVISIMRYDNVTFVKELEQKYRFNYPLHNKPQIDQKKEETFNTKLPKYEAYMEASNQQIELPLQPSPQQVRAIQHQGKIQFCRQQNEQQSKEIKSILNFQVDTKFIKMKPSKKKTQRQYQQIRRPQIQIIPNNCKYQRVSGMSQIQSLSMHQSFILNNNISEITFQQETRLSKFQQLLKKAPKPVEIEQYRSLKYFGNNELCEGILDGKIVQFIKTQQSNVIL
ncbi:unnamed protein product [Paramecium octaurelia]|uniref:Uncharacterized protein n=1 Tax=Paramecium octaurelia TaxID=43137 RepID=A0A8S1YGV8_PAROT|nr:unnamed protein product [Paramecium octaurelia]